MATSSLPDAPAAFGTLRLQVSTAMGAFPVAAATVEVSTDNGATPLYRSTTDQSGIADDLALPANPREASQSPATALDSPRRYTVTVTHPAFLPQRHSVSLFVGIKTILPVVLVPRLPSERRA